MCTEDALTRRNGGFIESRDHKNVSPSFYVRVAQRRSVAAAFGHFE
jgi:hypothetical protein